MGELGKILNPVKLNIVLPPHAGEGKTGEDFTEAFVFLLSVLLLKK